MIERETADALREAIEKLDTAMTLLSDSVDLRPEELVKVSKNVLHAFVLLNSILDKGR